MKLRTALVTLILAVLAIAPAQAQARERGPGGNGERRMQMMFKDITLTASQKMAVDSILASHRREAEPMAARSRPDSATMAHRRGLMQKQNAEIRAVLTREQLPVFDRNREEMRSAMQRRRGGR
jgi:Spy/CpxP family protein refolding chaperone